MIRPVLVLKSALKRFLIEYYVNWFEVFFVCTLVIKQAANVFIRPILPFNDLHLHFVCNDIRGRLQLFKQIRSDM